MKKNLKKNSKKVSKKDSKKVSKKDSKKDSKKIINKNINNLLLKPIPKNYQLESMKNYIETGKILFYKVKN